MKPQTQDIDIATNVRRVLAARDLGNSKKSIYVTALSAAKGLLWVGTNVGIALTIPLPRLEGVPIISGKANISYHAHFGPVRMFLPLQTKVTRMGFTNIVDPCTLPQVHAIEQTAPTPGRRPAVLPDPHSTIQEEETEAKPTFAKQVTIILLITSCSFRPITPFLTDLRRSSRGDTSAALVSNEAVLIANARPAKVITKTKTTSTQTIL